MNKKQTCAYSRHKCSRIRYRNYRYCFQHILEDRSAPFISCQYISKLTKRRCHNPALKNEQSFPAFCEIHQLAETSSKLRTKPVFEDRSSSNEPSTFRYEKLHDFTGRQNVDIGFLKSAELDAKSNSNWPIFASSSWRTMEADIDADSYDDDDNPLTNAGVYTLEEVALVSKQRMIKLQSLYLKQFNQLRRQLQEKRRQFLSDESITHSKQAHKEKLNKQKDEKLREFHSLVNYRKHSWKNQLLYRKSKRRRMQAMSKQSNTPSDSSNKTKCSHVTSHVRCKNFCLPYTKYCTSHIFEDPLQVLYKKCSVKSCNAPVCLLHYPCNREKFLCSLHQDLPPMSSDLDSLIEEIQSTSARMQKDQIEAVRSSRTLSDTLPQDQRGFSDSQSIFPNMLEDSPIKVCEDKEESTTVVTMMLENDTNRKDNGEPMNVDFTIPEDNPLAQNNETASEVKKTADDSLLSPAKMEEFKSGQCFFMNKVTVYDEMEKRCLPAIHLEPVDTPVSGDLPNFPETSKPKIVSVTKEGPNDANSFSDSDSVASENLFASVHHRGIIMSVEKETVKKDFHTPTYQKVSTSVTLIPPVERILPDSETTQDQNERLHDMPPLVPIGSSLEQLTEAKNSASKIDLKAPLLPIGSSLEQLTEAKNSASKTDLKAPLVSINDSPLGQSIETPTQAIADFSSKVSINVSFSEQSTKSGASVAPITISPIKQSAETGSVTLATSTPYVSMSISPLEQSSESSDALQERNSTTLAEDLNDKELHDSSSSNSEKSSGSEQQQKLPSRTITSCSVKTANSTREDFKSAKGDDTNELNSNNDRKPSSADEETAIASLLFLSSGTLQKH